MIYTTKQIKTIIEWMTKEPKKFLDNDTVKERVEKLKFNKKIEIAKEKFKTVPREDLAIMAENLEARTLFSGDGINNLYKAVCHQAVSDYKKARRYMVNGKDKKQREMAERDKEQIEQFFGEDFFKNVSGCGKKEETIKAIEKQMRREATKKIVI